MRIKISNKEIGSGRPVFIVAELSCNHLQDYGLAVKTIMAMKECGADAVKLQTFTPDTITIDSTKKYFRLSRGTLWGGKTLYELYKEAQMPWEWQPKLKKLIERLGMVCFFSVNDRTAVDFLETLAIQVYKFPSFEITDIPLIEYVASKGKPIILSTGVATLQEIKDAIAACRRKGNNKIGLLKCTSTYPSLPSEANLSLIPDMEERFKTVVGLSDHSLCLSVPVASVLLRAAIIEKHFILDRSLGGPDSSFSLEPQEFKQMVISVREAEMAKGKVSYCLTRKVRKNRIFLRSLFVVQDIVKDQQFTHENIRSIRPGHGLSPKYYDMIIGKKARKNLRRGVPLKSDMIYGW